MQFQEHIRKYFNSLNNFAWTFVVFIAVMDENVLKIIKKIIKIYFQAFLRIHNNFIISQSQFYLRDELSPFYSIELVSAFLKFKLQ